MTKTNETVNFYDLIDFSRKMTSEVETRKLIIKFFQDHPGWTYEKIPKEAKVCKKTVYNVIKRFKEDLTVNRRESSERKKGFRSPEKINNFSKN